MSAPSSAPADPKWWGWGRADHRPSLPESAISMLRKRLGVQPTDATEPVPLDAIDVPDPGPLPDPLLRAAGEGSALSSAEDRIRHAAGRSYPDLIRLRTGTLEGLPDAVVKADSAERVEAVLAACAESDVAVVPFGGGTSVVGGIAPISGPHRSVISLDLGPMRSVQVDQRSLTARLGPGLAGPDAETALGAQGVTLGHFPQSFEQATVGGFAATRSAGQASSGYGRFDDLVTAVELTAPAGRMRTLQTPHTAAGPSLRELVIGSEGTLGVITEVTCKVRPSPPQRTYDGWMAADWASGVEIVRDLAQRREQPDVLRLSDESETSISLEMSGAEGLQRRALDAYLGLRRRRGGCLIICGWEGERSSVRHRRSAAVSRLRAGGAARLGEAAGSSWERNRYEGPYLRDTLLDLGVFVETLETSHTWSHLDELYRAVGDALRGAMVPESIVMCHLSHAYPDGASLYYTFLARARRGEEIEQWRAAKTAACEAIVSSQATITHHHAVGRDHAPYMPAEVGELGIETLRAAKERLDPAGIMNPGKLLPS